VQHQSIFLGPLPPPADLERYAQIVPNGADRIMRLAEEHAAHEQTLERNALAANIAALQEELRLERRGQNLALAIGLPTLAGSVATAFAGHDGAAITLAATSLVGVVAAFLGVRFGGSKLERRDVSP
jgi:uncharacterized membrane protein